MRLSVTAWHSAGASPALRGAESPRILAIGPQGTRARPQRAGAGSPLACERDQRLETSYGSLLFPGDIDQYQPASSCRAPRHLPRRV